MQSYDFFSTRDFVADDAFVTWVINPDEKSELFWSNWLLLHPDKSSEVQDAIRIVKELSVSPDAFNDGEIFESWNKIHERISPAASAKIINPIWRRWYWVAACFSALLLFAAGLWQYEKPVSYSTAYGQIKMVLLPDSSVVTMNGNSKLSYSKGLMKREVTLSGEAYFQVKKQLLANQSVKFVVHTSRLDVQVLGTSFNVNSRRNDVEVMLKEGKVQLDVTDGQGAKMMLAPGQVATLSKGIAGLVKKKADPEKYMVWLARKRIYNGENLASVFKQIQDEYGIKTQVKNPEFLKKRFTGTINTDSLSSFYTQLQTIYKVRVKPVSGGYSIE
ncbi:FecR family protein [Dyadobacter koreensis]|uniref:FecR family protein n=1 Tax=Dyadobacter koreensis TaxID=408657 RepID=A0A1H6QPI3_9BACT|nr:FecR domain-containing protein [Dyadobacter koreensis]SEI45581.1 FecR family protein [Dyadobacter koreensis]